MDEWKRWLLIALALASLLAMMGHYGAVREDRFPYTSTRALAADYDAQLGEETYFWASVTAVEPDRIRVSNFALDLWVLGARDGVTEGDVVQVAGTVRPGHRIDDARVIVSPSANRQYMFAVSGLAGLIVAGLLLRHWTLDLRTLTVREREP